MRRAEWLKRALDAPLEKRLTSGFLKRSVLSPGSFGRVGPGFRRLGSTLPRDSSPTAGADGECRTGKRRRHLREGRMQCALFCPV